MKLLNAKNRIVDNIRFFKTLFLDNWLYDNKNYFC